MWYGEKLGFREMNDFITRTESGDASLIGEMESRLGMDILQYTAFDLNQSIGQSGSRFSVQQPVLKVKALEVLITEKEIHSLSDLLDADVSTSDPFDTSTSTTPDLFVDQIDEEPDPFASFESVSSEVDRSETLSEAASESLAETLAVVVEDLLADKMHKAQPEMVI